MKTRPRASGSGSGGSTINLAGASFSRAISGEGPRMSLAVGDCVHVSFSSFPFWCWLCRCFKLGRGRNERSSSADVCLGKPSQPERKLACDTQNKAESPRDDLTSSTATRINLVKPIDLPQLVAAIRRVTDNRGASPCLRSSSKPNSSQKRSFRTLSNKTTMIARRL